MREHRAGTLRSSGRSEGFMISLVVPYAKHSRWAGLRARVFRVFPGNHSDPLRCNALCNTGGGDPKEWLLKSQWTQVSIVAKTYYVGSNLVPKAIPNLKKKKA